MTIHATPSQKTVVTIMRSEVTIGTMNSKGILGMLADISWSGNKSGLLMSGHRSRKTTTSFKTRTFKTVAFDGDTRNDDVEKGIGRGRRVKISRAIKVVLGALSEELLEIRPDSIHWKIANEEVNHLPFLEGDPHGVLELENGERGTPKNT